MGIGLAGCHFWDNFTTYFNTYYNMDRLMFETEDEFEYLEEKKRVTPRLLVPEPDVFFAEESSTGAPPFMQEFVISQQKLQPVKIKLDSILIKGSKILAHSPKSDYVEGSLFLMAKAYFYRSEWLPSQIKCSELIDKFPAGDFSPDAHLLMAKNYLIQRKFHAGKILLSRTVDIAWIKDRYDILSEAFRLEADLALYLGEEEKALIPYRQAIVQTDDGLMKAKWQVELASLLFRMGKFEKAAVEFAKVQKFDPDYQAEFEGYLYQASSLLRIGQFEKADEILEDLEGDGNNEEWLDYIYAQRMNEIRLKDNKEDLEKAEDYADSVYINKPPITVTYFEIGMDYFKEFDYMEARKYFARAKNVRSPIFRTAGKLYELLNAWDRERTYAMPLVQKLDQNDTIPNEEYTKLASSLFNLGRIHTQIGNPDSSLYYYDKAVEITPKQDETSARYYYAFARAIEDTDPVKSDSLMTELVDRYPFTEYGEDAADRLGYTADFVIDTVKEIYSSGAKLRKHGDYEFAIFQFNKIYDKYPDSEYAPKSLYTIG